MLYLVDPLVEGRLVLLLLLLLHKLLLLLLRLELRACPHRLRHYEIRRKGTRHKTRCCRSTRKWFHKNNHSYNDNEDRKITQTAVASLHLKIVLTTGNEEYSGNSFLRYEELRACCLCV